MEDSSPFHWKAPLAALGGLSWAWGPGMNMWLKHGDRPLKKQRGGLKMELAFLGST